MSTVLSGPALARKIRPDFIDTWKRRYEAAKALLSSFVRFGMDTDDFISLYGYGETPVYPAYTPWGQGPDAEPHRYRTFEAEMRRWTSEVNWKTRDKRYSNLGSIEADARQAGENFGTLFERLVFQLLTGAADDQLLPDSLECPDGVGIFSGVDGAGAARFGVSGGNSLSSITFGTGQGLRDGFFDAVEQMLQFQDPRGQPALNPSLMDDEFIFMLPASRLKEASAAFKQQMVSIGGTSDAGNSPESNLVLDSGFRIKVWPTPRITSDVAFVISTGIHRERPLIAEAIGLPLVDQPYDKTNSRDFGRKGLEGVFWEHEMVPVPGLPIGAVKLAA